MGIANAQRTLDYIRILTEFISQPEYQNLIPIFSIVNEALLSTIGKDVLTSL
jgi:glucan 1,3-beta-glucosidase